MKRELKTLERTEIDTFLKNRKVGLLSLEGDRQPYAIPLAYAYDGNDIYLTMGGQGRKMNCIAQNKRACFVVYWVPEDFGLANMTWTSVICDGELQQVTEEEQLRHAVRTAENHMGLPEGAWDALIEKTLQSPENSPFWKLTVKNAAGRKA